MDATMQRRVWRMIRQCEDHADSQKTYRDRALKAYDGEAPDLEAPGDGYSQAVSRDVRTTIRKVLPSIMRTLLSNDRIVEYEPTGPGKEEGADQATDYVNNIVVPESNAERAIYDAIQDWATLKTGVLTWEAYECSEVKVQDYSNQPPDAMLGLEELGRIDNIEQSEDGLISFRLTRMEKRVDIRLRAIPRGSFLIHPTADSIETTPYAGERTAPTRSELVSQGYDKELIWSIPAEYDDDGDDDETEREGDDWTQHNEGLPKENERVLVYDGYARIDADDDGIAELYHVVLADAAASDKKTDRILLKMEPASEIPYAEIIGERDAHQFEGHSIAEDVLDVQTIKTALLRSALDNVYEMVEPTPAIDPTAFQSVETFYKRVRGQPHLLKPGRTMADAVSYSQPPSIAEQSLGFMQYFDAAVKERTGITDASGGVAPELLRDMTATSANMIGESGIAQAEMIIRNLARGGLRKAFKGLLRLVIAHADRPRTVRLRGEWVEFDPRTWDADMDCVVNVGLGAGSKERDLAVLQMIYGAQKEIVATLGPMNPFVKPDQLYNTLARMTEAAGFPTADPYFTKPDPQEIEAQMQARQGQPSPEEMKAQTQIQIEQAKAMARREVEQAQMQADLAVENARLEAEAAKQQMKLESDLQIARLKAELDLLKHRDQMALEYERLSQQAPAFAPNLPYIPGA